MEEVVILPQKFSEKDESLKIVDRSHNYVDVSPTRKLFIEWWPVTARIIIGSLYGNISSRQHAVRVLQPIIDSAEVHCTELHINSNIREVLQLHELYTGRLNIDTHHIHRIKKKWLDAIRMCFSQCEEVIRSYTSIKTKLHQRLLTFEKEVTSSIVKGVVVSQAVQHEILEMLRTEKQHTLKTIESECDLKLRATRIDAVQGDNLYRPDTRTVDSHIHTIETATLEKHNNEITTLKKMYENCLLAEEEKAINDIRAECESMWIVALQKSADEII